MKKIEELYAEQNPESESCPQWAINLAQAYHDQFKPVAQNRTFKTLMHEGKFVDESKLHEGIFYSVPQIYPKFVTIDLLAELPVPVCNPEDFNYVTYESNLRECYLEDVGIVENHLLTAPQLEAVLFWLGCCCNENVQDVLADFKKDFEIKS